MRRDGIGINGVDMRDICRYPPLNSNRYAFFTLSFHC